MAYTKQNFTNGQTLTAEHLNHIEDGIQEVEKAVGEIDIPEVPEVSLTSLGIESTAEEIDETVAAPKLHPDGYYDIPGYLSNSYNLTKGSSYSRRFVITEVEKTITIWKGSNSDKHFVYYTGGAPYIEVFTIEEDGTESHYLLTYMWSDKTTMPDFNINLLNVGSTFILGHYGYDPDCYTELTPEQVLQFGGDEYYVGYKLDHTGYAYGNMVCTVLESPVLKDNGDYSVKVKYKDKTAVKEDAYLRR